MNFERIWKIMEGSGIGAMDATIGMLFLPASVAVVILTGVLVSVIASIYPALVALKKKPSEILRVLE
jgi:ABC-type lipoprotein release transport system permease subunit